MYGTWSAFRQAVLHSFLSPNLQQTEKARLRHRRQQPGEPFGSFYRSVWAQFANIKPDMPEGELVAVLLRNGHPDITRRLTEARHYPRIEALIDAGKEAEARNEDEARYHALVQPPPVNIALNVQAAAPASKPAGEASGKLEPKPQTEREKQHSWLFEKKNKQCWRCRQTGHQGECPGICNRSGQHGHKSHVCSAPTPVRQPAANTGE
jgi:hypothetical protein